VTHWTQLSDDLPIDGHKNGVACFSGTKVMREVGAKIASPDMVDRD
tara:strand:- start:5065 stop:5202 length:138 start_codon:yes stop_codon:yes gene_type:complete